MQSVPFTTKVVASWIPAVVRSDQYNLI